MNSNDSIFFTFEGETHLAKITKCYDGDTVHCVFKHNGAYQKFHVRMDGYDSWEMRPNKSIPEPKRSELIQKANIAKERLQELILNKIVYVTCGTFDKYGRILGTIKLAVDDAKTVNDMMIEEGHGYVYHGGTKYSQ